MASKFGDRVAQSTLTYWPSIYRVAGEWNWSNEMCMLNVNKEDIVSFDRPPRTGQNKYSIVRRAIPVGTNGMEEGDNAVDEYTMMSEVYFP